MKSFDFKVGDKVRHNLGFGRFEISEVVGITPKGYVKVKWGDHSTLWFYQDGSQRGGDAFSRHRIKPVTQEDFVEHNRNKLASYLINKVSWTTLPYEKVKRIYEIVIE
jgi:hypothetical protein